MSYRKGLDILGKGGGGGHGGGHHGGGGHGGGGGHHGGGFRSGGGWWGGGWPAYDYYYDEVPYGYILVEPDDDCDLIGPNGECYQLVDRVDGYDSSAHAMTLRDAPIEDQVYGLQAAAAKTGSVSLIQAGKDLQKALSSWWATFSTGGIREQAAALGKAIAKWTGKDPLDGPPIAGGVSSAAQEQVFDQGMTGKVELATADVKESASERAQEAKNIASNLKTYTENVASKANTTLIIVAIAAGVIGLGVTSAYLYKATKK